MTLECQMTEAASLPLTTRGYELKLYWMKSSEAWPGGYWLESDRSCFDEDKPGRKSDSLWDTRVGDVHQLVGNPGGGLWLWSVTARFPGPRFPDPSSGREISREEAIRCVAECYELMLRFYRSHHPGA